MGLAEIFNLSWHNHSDHLRDALKELKTTENFADVTLVCEDRKQIKAHRYVLSACSPAFKDMLEIEPNNSHPLIYLRGIKHSEMESIMQFVYSGETTVHQERLKHLILVANSLEITELSKRLDLFSDTTKSVVDYNEHKRENQVHDKNGQHVPVISYVKAENFEYKKVMDVPEAKLESKAEARSEIKNAKKGICQHCDKTFNSKSGLKHHINANHLGRMFECDQCQMPFPHKSSLKLHIQSEHEGIKYTCNQCEKQFSRKNNLDFHIQTVHEGIKRYNCNQCDFQTKGWTNLRNHTHSKHEGRKFPCKQCDSVFSCESTLKKHTKSEHEGVKFSCDKCDKQFALKKYLIAHFQSVHLY